MREYLQFSSKLPYLSALDKVEADHISFVVNSRGDEWTLNSINLSNDTFGQRADLPAAWAGLKNMELEDANGVEGTKFFHSARFIAVASSRKAALKMTELAVKAVR